MISQDGDQSAPLAKREELIEDLRTFGSAVDAVAEDDEDVVSNWVDSLDQNSERCGATVDVADGNEARWHTVSRRGEANAPKATFRLSYPRRVLIHNYRLTAAQPIDQTICEA